MFRLRRISGYKALQALIVLLLLCVSGVVSIYPFFALAQSSDEEVSAREAELQRQLDAVLKDIDAQQKILNQKRSEGTSLENDIAILNAQIAQAKAKIKAHAIAIEGLGKDINVKNATIQDLEGRIGKNKESLAKLLEKTNELDSYSIVEVALANKSLSEFFSDIDAFDTIKVEMQTSFSELRGNKQKNELEKDSLLKKQLEEIGEKISVESEQKKIQTAEAEKKRLLALSKQEQANYQSVINDRQRQAAAIRAALFSLRDSAAIPFGKALEYANYASKQTGVRPAFILGILTQESNLGKNTGSCLLKDDATGSGIGANTGTPFANVMHPTRDVPVFKDLMAKLGRPPYETKISCPQSVGYGGAMGPAQFIASTWSGMSARVAAAVGKETADPWDPRDAIVASAMFLADLGAGRGTFAAEQEAAGRYYAGSGWATRGLGYAASVARLAQNIQDTMITPLQGI